MAHDIEHLMAKEKPEVLQGAKEKADEMRLELRIAEIRELCNVTQAQLAEAMGVKQPTIAGLEREGNDLRLSSLKRYVETMGGRVYLGIDLPDGSHHGFPI